MAIAGWEPNEAIKAGRNLRGWTQRKLADRVGALLEQEWSRDMIASIEAGKRTVDPTELVAFVVLLDLDYDYILRGVELELRNKAIAGRLNAAAGDRANPGWRDPVTLRTANHRDNRDLDHDPRSCIECIFNPNHLVVEDYTEQRGWHNPQIDGQQVIDIRGFEIVVEKIPA